MKWFLLTAYNLAQIHTSFNDVLYSKYDTKLIHYTKYYTQNMRWKNTVVSPLNLMNEMTGQSVFPFMRRASENIFCT